VKRRILVVTASALALAAASLYYLRREAGDDLPLRMNPAGEATNDGWVVRQRTVDYEAVVRSALEERASLIVLTLKGDVIRDQRLESSIHYTPLPVSTARVRVKYHVEYPIGFPLGSGDFSVSSEGGALVVHVRRPRLVARPSVRLLGYDVLESGILVDEKTAIIELQRRIQPEAERRGAKLAGRPSVAAVGERGLRLFLDGVLRQAARPDTKPPPPVVVRYR